MKILEILTKKRVLGNFGEDAAVKHLKKQGYKIIKRNYVAECGEVDVIAKDGDTLVFVEVKTRTYSDSTPTTYRPACAVTREKQRRIIRCAAEYNSKIFTAHRTRFDVIEVYTEDTDTGYSIKGINHIKAAFDKSSARR